MLSIVLIYSVITITKTFPANKEMLITTIDDAIDLLSKAKSEIPSIYKINEEEAKKSRPQDCLDLYERGIEEDGVYTIWPINRLSSNKSIDVYCKLKDEGGGWTVIMRKTPWARVSDYFDKDWEAYRKGFGSLTGSFWIGNDNIFMLTNQRLYTVRIHANLKERSRRYADCDFWIDDNFNKYTLHLSRCSGWYGKVVEVYNNTKFSTKDENNNEHIRGNCAAFQKFGGWHKQCGPKRVYKDLAKAPWEEYRIRPSNFLYFEYS